MPAEQGKSASANAFRWVFVAISGALASGFGFAAPAEPIADPATARAFNVRLLTPNLRETAAQAQDGVVIRLGVAHEDAAGQIGFSFGGATPEATELRDKSCAADFVVVATPQSEYRSAFSEDGSAIFTVRRFHVQRALRSSSVVPGVVPSGIVVGALGGTVIVNTHKISVLRPSVAEFRPGKTYLLFLRAIPGSSAFESPARSAYDISQEPAVSIMAKPLGLPGEDALEEIGRAATLCPYGPGHGALER